jgi:hypothetical protein
MSELGRAMLGFARARADMGEVEMSSLPPDPSQYCSLLSAQAGEPLAGTASQATTWLLLEYSRVWGAKAFEESSLPQAVKDYLSRALESLPAAKLQLISHHARSPQAGITFFVGHSGDRSPRLYEFKLDSYEAITKLNLPAILAGDWPGALRERPVILVCTNGRRDACCARWGMPTYLAISTAADQSGLGSEAVWQTTHVGGHRLAPNVLCFPSGLYYGRVQPEDGQTLVDYCVQGQVFLERLRGRSCYPPVVQAAERFLRGQTGRLEAGAFLFLDADEASPNTWLVRFVDPHTRRQYKLHIAIEATSTAIRQSCVKPKTEPLVNYGLIDYSTLASD